MKRMFLKVVCLIIICSGVAFSSDIQSTPSEAKWNEIHKRMSESFGSEFIERFQNQTGRPSSYEAALSTLKSTYEINPRILSYYLTQFKSKTSEKYGQAIIGSILILQTDDPKGLEIALGKIEKKTALLISKQPSVGVVLREDNFLVFISFNMLDMSPTAKSLISAINKKTDGK